MKIDTIFYSSHFKRSLRSIGKKIIKPLDERVEIFRKNCFDSRLKTHKTKGKLFGYWSFSVTHSHRVLFDILGDGEVVFIDIGDHSVYR